MEYGRSVRNNGPGTPAAVRDLLAVIVAAAKDDRLSSGLQAGLRQLGQDLNEGNFPVDMARDEVQSLLGGLALRKRGFGARCSLCGFPTRRSTSPSTSKAVAR